MCGLDECEQKRGWKGEATRGEGNERRRGKGGEGGEIRQGKWVGRRKWKTDKKIVEE